MTIWTPTLRKILHSVYGTCVTRAIEIDDTRSRRWIQEESKEFGERICHMVTQVARQIRERRPKME